MFNPNLLALVQLVGAQMVVKDDFMDDRNPMVRSADGMFNPKDNLISVNRSMPSLMMDLVPSSFDYILAHELGHWISHNILDTKRARAIKQYMEADNDIDKMVSSIIINATTMAEENYADQFAMYILSKLDIDVPLMVYHRLGFFKDYVEDYNKTDHYDIVHQQMNSALEYIKPILHNLKRGDAS